MYHFQKKHQWIRNWNVLARHSESIEFHNVASRTNYSNHWTIHGLDLTIVGSHLSETDIVMVGSYPKPVLKILFSTFGQLKVEKSQIMIQGCSTHGSNRTLLDIKNSSLSIRNSTFYENNANEGPSIVKAIHSNVNMTESLFTENSGQNGLIRVLNDSSLYLGNCNFKNNFETQFMKSLIEVQYSNVIMKELTFLNNEGTPGVVLDMVSGPSNSLHIKQCIFSNNSPTSNSSSLHLEDTLDITMEKSQFLNDSILISGGHLVKLSHVNFVTMTSMPQLTFTNGNYTFSTEQCSFDNGSLTLPSNVSNFLEKATAMKLIQVQASADVIHNEKKKKCRRLVKYTDHMANWVDKWTMWPCCSILGHHCSRHCCYKTKEKEKQTKQTS